VFLQKIIGAVSDEGVIESGIRFGRERHECEVVVEPLVGIPEKYKTEVGGNADVSKNIFWICGIVHAERGVMGRRNRVALKQKPHGVRPIA
jgi:hypothetical protein